MASEFVNPFTVQIIVFGGIVVGAFGRMMLPYLQKLKEAENNDTEPPKFQHKYIFTMIYSLALSLIAGLTLFPAISANIPANLALAAFPGIFFTTILAGWGANSIINNVVTMKS